MKLQKNINLLRSGRMKRYAVIVLTLLMASQSCFALGALYARRAGSNSTGTPLWLKSYDATVTITDQMAVTHVDHVFKNESSSRMEGVFVFPLPENAIVTELALWINGKRVVGDVMEKDTARAVYNSIVRRQIDPALLEYMGENVFKLSVFPIERNGRAMSERRIEITYAELLPYEEGRSRYTFFMKTTSLSSNPPERSSLSGTLKTQQPLIAVNSSTHATGSELSIKRISDTEYRFTFGTENEHSGKDFVLYYEVEQKNFGLNHLTYVPPEKGGMFFDEAGDDPYFVLWITPPDRLTKKKILNKNMVMVADISASMAGTRMEQLRMALTTMVDLLNPGDAFNIVSFSTDIVSFKEDLVSADNDTKAQAYTFINTLAESGLTNIEGALKRALAHAWVDTCVKSIVFLTDGKPTWPVESNASRIIDTVKHHSEGTDIALHTFGIGEGIEKSFLMQCAKENSGFFYHITEDDSISLVLSSFFKKISYPLIRDVSVSFGGLVTYDTYPKTLPNLYAGTQLAVLGRYKKGGEYTVECDGVQHSTPLSISAHLGFPAQSANQPFVPRMWASAKIDYLLYEIAVKGEIGELVDNVKNLGKKYNIITPYTSMLVVEPEWRNTGVSQLVEDKRGRKPATFMLKQNVPNPFRTTTTITFSVPPLSAAQRMALRVYDAQGKLVRTLVDDYSAGGKYRISWDGCNGQGMLVTPGVYIAVLEVGAMRQMISMRMVE
jgi:Ca-activated chloride channel family protein